MERKWRVVPREVSSADENRVWNPWVTTNGEKPVEKMKHKIRELTDRNNGMGNAKREKKYQNYVRGWVEYFKLADMKGLFQKTDEWARRRIRAVYWKQWKKIKTKYKMLKALGLEHWKAKELACSRKGYWRMAQVLNSVITNKIIAKLGYISILDYYLIVYENKRTALLRNRMPGGVRGRLIN